MYAVVVDCLTTTAPTVNPTRVAIGLLGACFENGRSPVAVLLCFGPCRRRCWDRTLTLTPDLTRFALCSKLEVMQFDPYKYQHFYSMLCINSPRRQWQMPDFVLFPLLFARNMGNAAAHLRFDPSNAWLADTVQMPLSCYM